MSRFYDLDDCSDHPNLDYGRWKRNSRAVLTSPRGKKVLSDFIASLEALPQKRLISGSVCQYDYDEETGDPIAVTGVCAVGAFALFKGLNLLHRHAPFSGNALDDDEGVDAEDTAELGRLAGMTFTMAHNLAYKNDEKFASLTPEQRWEAIHTWAINALEGEPSALINYA